MTARAVVRSWSSLSTEQGTCDNREMRAADEDAVHVDDRRLGVRFAADELVTLLHGHHALDLRQRVEAFEGGVGGLVADGRNDGLQRARDDVWRVAEFFDLGDHGIDLGPAEHGV